MGISKPSQGLAKHQKIWLSPFCCPILLGDFPHLLNPVDAQPGLHPVPPDAGRGLGRCHPQRRPRSGSRTAHRYAAPGNGCRLLPVADLNPSGTRLQLWRESVGGCHQGGQTYSSISLASDWMAGHRPAVGLRTDIPALGNSCTA